MSRALAALATSDAISDAWVMRPGDEDGDVPLVAVAPCATFAVTAAVWDDQHGRVVLQLREIREEGA
jgi:hypothetical protein